MQECSKLECHGPCAECGPSPGGREWHFKANKVKIQASHTAEAQSTDTPEEEGEGGGGRNPGVLTLDQPHDLDSEKGLP